MGVGVWVGGGGGCCESGLTLSGLWCSATPWQGTRMHSTWWLEE